MTEIVERPDFVDPQTCATLVDAFEALPDLQVGDPANPFGQRVIHYGALGGPGQGMDAFGHLTPADDRRSFVRQQLNGMRATLPRALGVTVPLYPELSILCRTPAGSRMPAHRDYPWRALTAVIYLNQGFSGGLTRFADGRVVAPAPGKLALFKGADIEHEVTEVAGGPRYTISLWWSQDPARLEA